MTEPDSKTVKKIPVITSLKDYPARLKKGEEGRRRGLGR